MKRLVLCAVVCTAVAAGAAEFDGWTRLEKGAAAFNYVRDPDFDDATFMKDGRNTAWSLMDEAHIGAEYGFNQRGVAIVRPAGETNKYSVSYQMIKGLKPRTRYTFGCKYKVTGSDGRTSMGVGIEGLTVPVYFAVSGNHDWTDYKTEFVTTDKPQSVSIVLFVRKGRWCTAMYDNFYIREVGGEYLTGMLNTYNRVTDDEPDMIFALNTIGEVVYPGSEKAKNVGFVVVKDKTGKIVLEKRVPITGRRFTVSGKDLAKGDYTLNVTVADVENKLVLTSEDLNLQVGVPAGAPKRGVVTFDKLGRTLVDGKPFLPLAVYVGGTAAYQNEWFARSPFNTYLAYSGFWSKVNQSKYKGKEALREALDLIDKAGKKIILSSATFFPKYDRTVGALMSEWGFKKGETDYDTFLAHCTESIKDHPALLGYYITDELPPERYRELIARRNMYNRVDPFHPTTGVYFRLAELANYTAVSDAPSIDFYPISGKGKPQSQKLVTESMDMANEVWARPDNGQMPFWATLQMFSWGGSNPDTNKNYRMPTENESVAMAFMSAIGGAKGFIWYYLFDICHAQSPDPQLRFSRFEANWKTFCNAAQEIKNLEPFILSTTPAPKVTVKDVKGRTRARAFVDDEYGRIRVLIACDGPGQSEAEITVDGPNTDALVAKFNRTQRETKDGRTIYRFKGNDVDCDLLQRWPEIEFNKDLRK